MGDALKCCPFCEGDAALNDYEAGKTEGLFTLPKSARKPYCTRCGCDLGYFDTEAEAIAAWNRRATPAPAISGERWEKVDTAWAVIPSDDTPGHREPVMVDTGNGMWGQVGTRDRNPEATAAVIVACVNALAGIENPEAAVRAVKEALEQTKRFLTWREEEDSGTYLCVTEALALLGGEG